MIEILPVQDKLLQESACLISGIKYDPELMAYAAYSNGRLAGICQFAVNSAFASIVDLKSDNKKLSIIISCAVLHFIDLCGVHYATFTADFEDEALLTQIGFKKNSEGVFDVNLEGFFTSGHCH